MDKKPDKLSSAIETFRNHKTSKNDDAPSPQSRPRKQSKPRKRTKFCGEIVNKRSLQLQLNLMDPDERIHRMQYDLEHIFTDRIESIINDDEADNNDAISLCSEWGSMIGNTDQIEGDDPNKYLLWTTIETLDLIHRKKQNLKDLLDT